MEMNINNLKENYIAEEFEKLDDKQKFLYYIRMYQDSIEGRESYGNTTEFYDEDGCVLFIVEYLPEENAMKFKFADESENEYKFSIIDQEMFDLVNSEFFGQENDDDDIPDGFYNYDYDELEDLED